VALDDARGKKAAGRPGVARLSVVSRPAPVEPHRKDRTTVTRMTRVRAGSALLALLAVGVIAAGCGSSGSIGAPAGGGSGGPSVKTTPASQSGGKPFRLGLVLTDRTVSTINQIYVGAEQRAHQVGNVQLVEGGSSKTVDWLNACENIIHSHIDALVYSTIDEKGTRNCIKQANAMNLPIICVLPCTPIGKRNVVVSIDFRKDGGLIGQWMAKTLNGKGNVGVLDGAPGDQAAAELVSGFKSGLGSACPGCKVVAEAPGGFNRETAYNSALSVLAAHPNLNGIYSLNDDGALGAMRAVQQQGKLRKIAIAGHNGSCDALSNIMKNGGMGFTVLLAGQPLGAAAVDIAMKLAKGTHVDGQVNVNAVPTDQKTALGYANGSIPNPPGVDVRAMLKTIQSKGCKA
jgi:ABC-type sugar transport system substrate-binding protein